MQNKKQRDLGKRLIRYCIMVNSVVENTNDSKSGRYLSGQLIRSGSSPALNYGEACAAESLNDLIHKFKIILKELRESYANLSIIQETPLISDIKLINTALNETNELISIFVASIKTCERKKQEVQKPIYKR